MTICPTDDRLRSLLDGRLAEAEQAELQQHIDSCERCQQTLEGLVAGKESWDGIARRLSDGDTPVSPALHEAINAAKELEATIPSVKLPPGLLQPSEQPDSLGRLAHYEILQEVGSGGMGIVLKAFDTSLRRVVAIKVMAPHLAANAAARRRFVREAQAAAAVAHEHVVAIHAVSDQHDPPYLAMQFIEGKTLQERLDKSGPLSVREVLRIGMQTAAGLAAAHAQGLVHRDIKPANILLENGVERVKLTDFGLARAVDDASVTQSGVIAGTPLFMSPEQARGESIDHRSDLFSLGSVMYAMCVGFAPFRASTTMGVLKRVCDEPPRPIRDVNPDIPDWLTNIIDKLLAKKPSDRFQSAKEVAELLGQCLAHLQQPQSVPVPRTLGQAEMPPTSRLGDPSKSNAPAIRPTRIGLVTGLLGGMMTIGWLVQSTSHPVQGPAGVWLAFMCEVGLFLMALFFLLAGVLAGWNHGIREQPRTAGSMLRGFGFAAVCLTLFVLLTDNLAGRWKERRNECSVRFEVTHRADADLRFELSPTLIPASLVFSLPHNELLAGVPANGTISRLPPGEYQLRVHRDHRVIYSEPLKLYPGQWFTWPLLPSSLETFEKLQGRWQIVSASGNISTPVDDSISDWWIEFNEDRVTVSDAARSGVLQRSDLRFGIAPNSVVPSFDLIGHARGTFLFEGDRLTLRLANPGQPSVSTSDLNTTQTQIFCCRIVPKSRPAETAVKPTTTGSTTFDATNHSDSQEPIAQRLFDEAGVWSLTRSFDGKRLAGIGPNGGGGGSKVKVWDATTLTETLSFTDERTIHDLVFLPDGQRLATVDSDHRLRLRNMTNGGVLQESEPFSDPMLSLAASDDGETLLFAGPDLLVRMWDVKTSQVRKVFSGATTPIHSVAISADGKVVAAGCDNGHVLIWDAKTAERLHLWTHFDRKVTSVAFSPNSQHLAAASWNHLACVFDLGNDYPTKFLKAHTNHVRTIAWSPDGKLVATASSDGSAIVWDAVKANRLAVFNAKVNQCFDAVFLDNDRFATAHRDGIVRVWSLLKSPTPGR